MLAILAIFMHFAVQITPLWTPLMGAQTIQICTAQGFDSVTIDEYGREVPTPKQEKSQCNLCLVAGAAITQPEGPTYVTLIPASEQHKRWLDHQDSFPKHQKYAAHLTRGPPAVS